MYYQKEHQRITNNTDSGQWLIVTDATGDRWVKCEELRFRGRGVVGISWNGEASKCTGVNWYIITKNI